MVLGGRTALARFPLREKPQQVGTYDMYVRYYHRWDSWDSPIDLQEMTRLSSKETFFKIFGEMQKSLRPSVHVLFPGTQKCVTARTFLLFWFTSSYVEYRIKMSPTCMFCVLQHGSWVRNYMGREFFQKERSRRKRLPPSLPECILKIITTLYYQLSR